MSEMNFSSLVSELRSAGVQEVEKKQRTITAPQFEVSLISYPDVVISRKTSRTTKHLIIMPSQNMYYIKAEDGSVTRLDASLLTEFCRGCSITLDDFWVKNLPAGKKEAEAMMRYLETTGVAEMLKYHAAPNLNYENCSRYGSMWGNIDKAWKCYKICPSVYKTYAGNSRFIEFTKRNAEFIEFVYEMWGVSGVNSFVDAILSSIVNVSTQWLPLMARDGSDRNVFRRYRMTLQSAIDYIVYESVHFGYADAMSTFFRTWFDTLDMQNRIYNKIKEKYPESLPTLHNRLSYQSRVYMDNITANMFARQVEKTKELEWLYGDYVFLAPKKKEDFRDEATQQANCLAGYIEKYADGHDHIIFMRKADAQDTSLITIEVSNDNQFRLLQAYRAHNRHPSMDEMDVIEKWLDHIRRKNGVDSK